MIKGFVYLFLAELDECGYPYRTQYSGNGVYIKISSIDHIDDFVVTPDPNSSNPKSKPFARLQTVNGNVYVVKMSVNQLIDRIKASM